MSKDTASLRILKASLSGQNLRNLLKAKGITKYRLAKDCGITFRTLCNWQKGEIKPSDEYALLVGKYLGLIKPNEAEKIGLMRELDNLKKKIERLSG